MYCIMHDIGFALVIGAIHRFYVKVEFYYLQKHIDVLNWLVFVMSMEQPIGLS